MMGLKGRDWTVGGSAALSLKQMSSGGAEPLPHSTVLFYICSAVTPATQAIWNFSNDGEKLKGNSRLILSSREFSNSDPCKGFWGLLYRIKKSTFFF